MVRLAVVTSHPIQYNAPLFHQLAKHVDLEIFFGYRPKPEDQARAGFGVEFVWDVDLTSRNTHTFLTNTSRRAGSDYFFGCDTPEIGTYLRERRFDVLLVMGWHLRSYVQAMLAAKRIGLPVMVRGDSQLGSPRSVLKKTVKALTYPPLLRLFDAALYVGERSRAYYARYRYPPQRLFFSPHCVDTEWFASGATVKARDQLRKDLGIPPNTKLLLFAGKLVSFKNPLDLLRAVAVCRREGLRAEVLVAGDGELRGQLIAEAAQLDVPLHLLGFCNQSRMPAVYAASDALVLPSNAHETWGLVANEALACGRPIIVSDACGCAPDLATNGRVGRAFRVGNVEELAQAIGALFADMPSQQETEALSEKYSVEVAADGIVRATTHCYELQARRGARG